MNEYRTIKDLVIESCIAEGCIPSYEKLTSLVRQHFPNSKWKKTHYAWYKSKIKTGGINIQGISLASNGESDDEIETEIEESIEYSVSLEKDLHQYLSGRVDEIEPGLVLVEDGVEYQIDAGIVDLLAKDNQGSHVVIELKGGKAKDAALGQLLGYVGCLSSVEHQTVRGILVASSFDSRVVFAAKGLPNVKLVKYQLSFHLEEIS